MDSKLVELNLNVETPSSQVIKRNGVWTEHTEIIVTTSAFNLDLEWKDQDKEVDIQKLITHSRGIDKIWNLLGLDDWALVDAEFKSNARSETIKYYHIVQGWEFGKENLPSSFRNMKTTLICHLNSENHQKVCCFESTEKWKKSH